MDELFEILNLRQTGKIGPLPIVLFDEAYWRSIINFDALSEAGMIASTDRDLLRFAGTAEDGWAKLVACGLSVPAVLDAAETPSHP